jgi:hypothetical protein
VPCFLSLDVILHSTFLLEKWTLTHRLPQVSSLLLNLWKRSVHERPSRISRVEFWSSVVSESCRSKTNMSLFHQNRVVGGKEEKNVMREISSMVLKLPIWTLRWKFYAKWYQNGEILRCDILWNSEYTKQCPSYHFWGVSESTENCLDLISGLKCCRTQNIWVMVARASWGVVDPWLWYLIAIWCMSQIEKTQKTYNFF